MLEINLMMAKDEAGMVAHVAKLKSAGLHLMVAERTPLTSKAAATISV